MPTTPAARPGQPDELDALITRATLTGEELDTMIASVNAEGERVLADALARSPMGEPIMADTWLFADEDTTLYEDDGEAVEPWLDTFEDTHHE